MNNKTNGEKLFIVVIICICCFGCFCLIGCTGSCMGCSFGCESQDSNCVNGVGYTSDGCGSEESCYTTWSCIERVDDKGGNILLLSFDGSEDGCSGEEGCYNGLYCSSCGGCGNCSGCGTCGVFCGSREGYDTDEMTLGCVDGCITCGDSYVTWDYLLRNIYIILEFE